MDRNTIAQLSVTFTTFNLTVFPQTECVCVKCAGCSLSVFCKRCAEMLHACLYLVFRGACGAVCVCFLTAGEAKFASEVLVPHQEFCARQEKKLE